MHTADSPIYDRLLESEETAKRARPPAYPPLWGQRVGLRELDPNDYRFAHALGEDDNSRFLWRFRGTTPSPEMFVQRLWANVLAQFVAVRVSDGAPIGLASAYNADFKNGHAYLALALEPDFTAARWAHDITVLFVNYLFCGWPFRKLYGETGERNMRSFSRGSGKYFHEEGRLKAHEYFDGRYWDTVLTAMYRDEWEPIIARDLPRILGTRPARVPSGTVKLPVGTPDD
jgi:RimJ/RimL family protein N-acetyltransferase